MGREVLDAGALEASSSLNKIDINQNFGEVERKISRFLTHATKRGWRLVRGTFPYVLVAPDY